MPQRITVVVSTLDPGSDLNSLVAGLDAQTVRADSFEVVVADGGSTDGTLARLQRLSRSRPNLTVLPDATLADAVSAAAGDQVLVLDQGCRLLPEALDRLAARADGADVVVGRRRRGRGGYAGPLAGGADEVASASSPLEEAGDAVLLVRRELLAGVLAEGSDGWAPRVLAGATALATVPDYACGWTAGPDVPAPLTVASAAATWSGDVLELKVTVIPGDEYLLVLDGVDGVEIALPTTATPVPSPPVEALPAGEPGQPDDPAAPGESAGPTPSPARVQLSAELACGPGTAPAQGVYRVRVQRRGGTGGAADVPAEGAFPALLSGRPVLAHAAAGELQVDVGTTATSLLSTLPAAGTVTESARGSLLRLPLPDLHVDGPARIAGTLAIGGVALPAEVLAEETAQGWGGELRCYVSGLEGRRPIGTRFGGGRGRPVPSGVDLVMSHLGTFTLEPTPPEPPAAPAATPPARPARPAAAKQKPKKKAPQRPPTRLQQLRRRVPPWLEPAVRPVAALPPARALYRRLNRP